MADDDWVEIPLGNHLIAIVDPADANLARMGWMAKQAGKGKYDAYYALHTWRIGKERGEYYLHNLVWEAANNTAVPKNFLVDHINRDKLDNRRSNLRLATRSDNEANKRKRRGKTTSKYKGVSFMKGKFRNKPWRAIVVYEKKQINLGVFATQEEAARAYDKAAKEYYAEFAWLNFPKEHDHDQSE